MLDYLITNHMVSYNVHKTLDLIFKNFRVSRVIIYLF